MIGARSRLRTCGRGTPNTAKASSAPKCRSGSPISTGSSTCGGSSLRDSDADARRATGLGSGNHAQNENGSYRDAEAPVPQLALRQQSAEFDVLGAGTLGTLPLRERHSLTLL